MYEDNTYKKILDRMLSRVADKFDKREGSVIYDAHSPAALELQYLYIELERIISEAYGDTASREFLILRCKERGITPYQATCAVLKGEFTPADIDVTGRRFNIGSMNFFVTEKIADGEYQVQCETSGIVGNQQMGTMIPIDYIEGLKTAELTEVLIPGEDEEETEVLRTRYFDSLGEQAFGGNRAAYLKAAGKIEGIGGLKVTRVWNGDIRPADMIPGEKVSAWVQSVLNGLEEEVAAWLSTVCTASAEKKLTVGGTILVTVINSFDYGEASDALLNKVQNELDPSEQAGEGYGLAPIGHVVNVKSAEPVQIFVTVDVTFEDGYSWNNLNPAIKSAIDGYLLELRKAWADVSNIVIRMSQIEARILGIKGVIDVTDTKLNGKAENIILNWYQVPVTGGVST